MKIARFWTPFTTTRRARVHLGELQKAVDSTHDLGFDGASFDIKVHSDIEMVEKAAGA